MKIKEEVEPLSTKDVHEKEEREWWRRFYAGGLDYANERQD